MTWTYKEIENDWLMGNRIALSPQDLVEAFDEAERRLGREWIEESRVISGAPTRGTSPTLHVATTGRLLATLDGVESADLLIEEIRRGNRSATAELIALYLLRTGEPRAKIELYQSAGIRVPDFRVRVADDPWAYVEVAQPDVSEAEERVRAIGSRVGALAQTAAGSFSLEVFLRREPTEAEVNQLVAAVTSFCALVGPHRRELESGLGMLILNETAPGQIVLNDHGEPQVPRTSTMTAAIKPDGSHRHIVIRLPYTDDRAEAFLTSEAKQLPKDAPGLVMIAMGNAPGGFRTWEPLMRRRLQPTVHTRVGGIGLFGSGLHTTPDGEKWIPRTQLLLNPHAKLPLPHWIQGALAEAGREYQSLT